MGDIFDSLNSHITRTDLLGVRIDMCDVLSALGEQKKERTSASVSSVRGYLAKNISSTGVFGDGKKKKKKVTQIPANRQNRVSISYNTPALNKR